MVIAFGHVVLLIAVVWGMYKIVGCLSPEPKPEVGDKTIRASGECCPCGGGAFRRIARCDDSTDFLNLHYDICDVCGFETYAYNSMAVKTERYEEWKNGIS